MRAQCKQMPEMVIVDDGYEQSMHETKKKSWNEYLCLSQRIVHPSDEIATVPVPTFRLYRCGFHNGKYRIEEIKSSILHQRDLSNSRAFIIDCGPHYGAWIWVGKYADAKDKSEAMRNARGFVKKVNCEEEKLVLKGHVTFSRKEFWIPKNPHDWADKH